MTNGARRPKDFFELAAGVEDMFVPRVRRERDRKGFVSDGGCRQVMGLGKMALINKCQQRVLCA